MTDMALDKLRTTDDLDVAGKRIVIRADLNVPVRDGQITDDTRITRFLPTVRSLAERGAKVIILSHFGRPKGERVPDMTPATNQPWTLSTLTSTAPVVRQPTSSRHRPVQPRRLVLCCLNC